MASNIAYTLPLLSCLILFTSLFQTCSAISEPLSPDSSHKVPVGIYYQSIANAGFFTAVFSDIITLDLLPIVDLHLSPWGNSRILDNGTFECQEGEEECYLNTVEACVIDVWPEAEKNFKLILCIENSLLEKSQWKTCFEIFGMSRIPVEECINNGRGKELELMYANETAALQPPHIFTPWVLVDGKAIEEEAVNIVFHICKAYKGPSPPKFCKNLPLITTTSSKSIKLQVRWREILAEAEKFARSKLI